MIRVYAFDCNIIYMCLYPHVFLFKNVKINFMLYFFSTRPYYIIYLHFTSVTIRANAFHFNIINIY